MPFQRFFTITPIVAGALAMALSGCVAVPLAQMAVTQMAPQPACAAPTGCQPAATGGSFGGLSQSVSDSFHKLTSLASDSQPVPPQAPAK
jgi:starvation-inducible outer membrane lipoprotein